MPTLSDADVRAYHADGFVYHPAKTFRGLRGIFLRGKF